jgi:hypothetical protein
VSFLAGPPALGERVFRRFLGRAGGGDRPLVVAPGGATAVAARFAAALPGDTWRRRAAASASRAPDELLRALARKTPLERDLAVAALPASPAARALLLGEPPAGQPLAALHPLLAPDEAPALLLLAAASLATAARAAAALVEETPALTVAVAGPGDAADAGGRAAALLAEGRVPLRAPSPAELRVALADELAALERAVARRDDAARSAAERFLAACLELHAETAGRFALNADPGFRFGGRPAEVDLLAAGLHIAVEIDGWHHLQDEDAYRRDRRKDLELQRHGYLVLRFLAADVVRELETILTTIIEAVRDAAARRS